MKLYSHQQKFADDNPDKALLAYDTGCLHGDTLITDVVTGITKSARDRHADGTGFSIYSYDETSSKFVIAQANPVQKYSKSPFVSLGTSNGTSVDVTPEHRILIQFPSGNRYIKVSELISCLQHVERNSSSSGFLGILQPPSAYFPFPLVSSSASSPSLLRLNVRRCLSRALNCLCCYLIRHRLCGRQLPVELKDAQDVPPLPVDALSHSHHDSYEGALVNELGCSLCVHSFFPHSSPLSKRSFLSPLNNKLCFAIQPHAFSGDNVPNGSRSSLSYLQLGYLNLAHKVVSFLLRQILILISYTYSNNDIYITQLDTSETFDNYYDFHVPKYENYVLNGYIHHNCGKSFLIREFWLLSRLHLRPLVVCPKAIKGDWEDPRWTTCSKEEFKKLDLTPFGCIVIDEVHFFASPLFVKGRSQMSTTLYEFVRAKPDAPIVIATATPLTNNPWSAHTLLTYIGEYTNWKKYRKDIFQLVYKPYSPRPFYEPIEGWRPMVRDIIAPHVYHASLADVVDVPELKDIVHTTKPPKYVDCDGDTPMEEWALRHRAENIGNKLKDKKLLNILEGHSKAVVVCHFRDQIEYYKDLLSKKRTVYTLHGGTKDQNATIKEAENDPECVIIIQAQVSAGYELPSFSVMVFASMSYSHVHHTQMRGRILRINNLHACHYHYLLGGKQDRNVHGVVSKGKDFNLSNYVTKVTNGFEQEGGQEND